ncbi:MAG: hypothetical protein IT330_11640 [Anaerolineae bacterium]|nr:hypothetical protein [Anaerolineae bacterium]
MPPIRDLLIVHHSHTDIGYTNYQDNVFAMQRDYIHQAMDLAEAYADGRPGEQFKWTCETTVIVDDFLRHATPAEIDRLQRLNRRGLIGVAGMFANLTPLYSAEMLARTLYIAGRLRRDHSLDIRYGLNCDVNGQSWGLVEMLLDAGFDGFAMAINRVMARDPQPRPIGFWWQGPSGRRLLVWNGEIYAYGQQVGIPLFAEHTPGGHVWTYDLEQSRRQVQRYLEGLTQQGYPYDFAYLQNTSTFLVDNGGPHEELVRFVREWNGRGWEPRLWIATPHELFERLRRQPPETLATHAGEWNDWWAQGVGSAAYETAVARRSQARLFAVEGLAAALQGMPEPLNYPKDDDDRAWQSLALFDEHTWGGFDSIFHAESANSRGQWHRKAAYAYEGAAAVARLGQRALRNLAARLAQPDDLHVTVFNPLPWPRRLPLYLPALTRSGWEAARLESELELSSPQSLAAANVDYGVIDLPACGYTTVPVRLATERVLGERYDEPLEPVFVPRVAPALVPTVSVGRYGWALENRFYRLAVDSTTGAIRSLVDKASGHEWVDASTPWRLGHYVYEEVRSPNRRYDMQIYQPPPAPRNYDHQPDLAPLRRGPERVLEQRFVAGVGNARFALRLAAPGARELQVQIVLYDDLPWLDLIYDIRKTAVEEPESVYVVFPFNLYAPASRYESAGAIVQAEAQQLPDSCRDFYAIQNWVDVSDENRGVTVASPDAPMIHLGGFTNHRYAEHLVMEQPYLVGWPLNNHWFTNFPISQSGWVRIRYRLLPHESPFDPMAATRFGAEAAVEPLIGPVWDRPAGLAHRAVAAPVHLPDEASFLSLEPDHVHLIGLKPVSDGRGLIARMQELAGRAVEYTLRFPLSRVAGAELCNLVEDKVEGEQPAVSDHEVRGHIEPYRLQTVRVVLAQE